MATNTKQKEYQRNYDKKTKMISVKYALHEMDDYDRFMNYLERTGKSANGFIKELINNFFEHKGIINRFARCCKNIAFFYPAPKKITVATHFVFNLRFWNKKVMLCIAFAVFKCEIPGKSCYIQTF